MDIMLTTDAYRTLVREEKSHQKERMGDLINQKGYGGSFSNNARIEETFKTEIALKEVTARLEATQNLSKKTQDKLDFIPEVEKLMAQFKEQIGMIRSDTQNEKDHFKTNLTGILKQLEDAINHVPSLGGGGELYNTKVVDFSRLTKNPDLITPDYSYAYGGDSDVNIHLDLTDATWDIANFTAKSPMIEEFVRAVRLAQMGDIDDPKDPYFEKAYSLVLDAEKKMITTQQEQAEFKRIIDTKIEYMKESETRLQSFYEKIAVQSIQELLIKQTTLENDLIVMQQMLANDFKSLKEIRTSTNNIIYG